MQQQNEKTIKCPICGEPYKVYADSMADQTACPDCVKLAQDKQDRYYTKPRN